MTVQHDTTLDGGVVCEGLDLSSDFGFFLLRRLIYSMCLKPRDRGRAFVLLRLGRIIFRKCILAHSLLPLCLCFGSGISLGMICCMVLEVLRSISGGRNI